MVGSDEYRKGLDYANELAKFNVENAPTVAAETIVRRAVASLQKLYGTSRRLKQTQIVRFMHEQSGNASQAEIVVQFSWPKQLVSDLVGEMVEAGVLIKYKSETAGSGPRGGRPAVRYRLKS